MGFSRERSSRPPSKDEFAKLLMRAVQEAGETRQIIYDRQEFRLRPAGEDDRVVFLGNLYAEYCDAEEADRESMLRKWVRVWFTVGRDLPDDFADLQPDLLPALRGLSYLEHAALLARIKGQKEGQWPHRIVAEHLGLGLVYDLPESIQSILQSNLDDWGVTFYEALETAQRNLAEKGEVAALGEGLYVVAKGRLLTCLIAHEFSGLAQRKRPQLCLDWGRWTEPLNGAAVCGWTRAATIVTSDKSGSSGLPQVEDVLIVRRRKQAANRQLAAIPRRRIGQAERVPPWWRNVRVGE